MAGRIFQFDDPFLIVKREMDQLLNTFLGPVPSSRPAKTSGPGVNMWEVEDALYVELEVPGFTFEELDLTVSGRELTIKTQKKSDQVDGWLKGESVTWHRRERSTTDFSRSVLLPLDVQSEMVEATLRDGVLTIKLPKAESAKSRKIKVNA